jgi:hypothetical protein
MLDGSMRPIGAPSATNGPRKVFTHDDLVEMGMTPPEPAPDPGALSREIQVRLAASAARQAASMAANSAIPSREQRVDARLTAIEQRLDRVEASQQKRGRPYVSTKLDDDGPEAA